MALRIYIKQFLRSIGAPTTFRQLRKTKVHFLQGVVLGVAVVNFTNVFPVHSQCVSRKFSGMPVCNARRSLVNSSEPVTLTK